MADTVAINWIFPPNWDGNQSEPGEKHPGYRKMIVQLICLSDGTGETDVQKVDISELRNSVGEIVTRTVVEKVEYNISGLNVLLEWDRAPHAEICRLVGANGAISGCIKHDVVDPSDGVDDRTGDILLTTTGFTAGDGYNITLHIRLK